MADLKISELSALAGVDLVAADQLAIADASASETKRITVTDLVGNATTLIADATIPGAKILFGSQQVPGSALEDGAVDTTQLADDAVTAAKLADQSSVDLVTTLPASGAFVGQIALDTDDNKVYAWSGSQWLNIKGAGSINTVIGGSTGIVNVTVTTSGDQVTINTTLDDTTGAGEFLAGPSGAGGTVGYRTVTGNDLPVATTTTKGAVLVNGEGLTMDGDRIEIDNTVVAVDAEYHVVQYTDKGLINASRLISGSDLPAADPTTKGAVFPGSGLTVLATGELNHSNTVTPGTYGKVTVDAQGHVSAGLDLQASDIPGIDADKITSGEFPTARIDDDAVTGAKLANYSTAQIANAAPTAEYIGQLFFNPLDRTLFMWDGNVYQPVGVSYGQVVFAGIYDASTNLVTSITPDGAAIGLAVGAALVSPVAANRAHYVVVDQPGTGVAPAPTVSLSPPDILLSTGSDWVLLDVSDTVTAQLASNVQVTPAGNIASSNVQAALQELDTEKLALTGGTLTGDLNLGVGVDIVFEGANANANETTLTVADPTADRTITLPNVSGTVVTTGDTGTVTSTMIADGTIVNADINASAAIGLSKLATGALPTGITVASANIVDGTIVNADVNASAAIAGTKIDPDFGSQTIETTGVFSAAGGSAAAPSITFTGDTNTGIYSPGADQVALSTNGTGRLFIDASGNVGIGTSSPNSYANYNTLTLNGTTGGSLDFESNGTLIGQIYSTSSLFRLDAIGAATETTFITNNSERMRIDSSGRVGIGTSSVSNTLHVVGAAATIGRFAFPSSATTAGNGGAHLRIQNTDSTSGNQSGIFFANSNDFGAAGVIAIHTPSTNAGQLALGTRSASGYVEAMRIDSSQRVGIGNTTAGSYSAGFNQLVVGSSGDQGVTIVSGTSNSGTIAFADGTSGADAYRGYVQYQHGGTNALVFATDGSERFRCDSSGRLLVGTSSYAGNGRLVAAGNTSGSAGTLDITWTGSRPTAANTDIGYIRWYVAENSSSNAHYASIYAASDGASSGTGDIPGRLVFSTTPDGLSNPTERMRITQNGSITFQNAGTSLTSGVGFKYLASATNPQLGIVVDSSTATSHIHLYNINATNNGYRFYVSADGGIANYSANDSNLSDRNVKKDISPAAGTWDCIKEWEIVNYRYKDQPDDADLNLGVIAQQVAESCPEVITVFEEAKDDQPEKLGVKEQQMYWMAIKALQEAQVRIEALEAEVAALKAS